MTWLYATELTVLAFAFIFTPWMKQQGDESWRRHQLIGHLRDMVAAAERMAAAMSKFADQLGEFGKSMRADG